jgi:inorganic phosphate transporter, PiT family
LLPDKDGKINPTAHPNTDCQIKSWLLQNPMQGSCAETAGAITLFLATFLGILVSTTHTIADAIAGVGAARRASAVRWNIAGSIVIAWLLTLPTSALLAAFAYYVARIIA